MGRLSVISNFLLYFQRHFQAASLSATRLFRTPFASLLTISVIAIAFVLPTGLYIVLSNVQSLGTGWEHGTQISVFLKMDTTREQTKELLNDIRLRADVADVRYISPEQGLQELQQHGSFGDVLDQLPNNPLPAVIDVFPSTNIQTPQLAQTLLQNLQTLPHVETAKLDMQWLERMSSLIWLAQRAVYALVLLLGCAVLFIVGNTIRLAMQSHHREIEVIKLFGGSNAFVRRPFLYTGLFFGLGGGIIAWLLVMFIQIWLQAPITRIASLYHSNYQLAGLSFDQSLGLLFTSGLLGLFGAWIAVRRQLAKA